MTDIDSLRGLDGHQAALAETELRLVELEKEADGRPFTAAQDTEWESLNADKVKLSSLIAGLVKRRDVVAGIIEAGGASAERVGIDMPNIISKPSAEDVFDLAGYRRKVGSVDQLPEAYREGAMRVLESAVFPNLADQAAGKDQVAKLIAKHRHDGAVARRIIETGSPLYAEAWANKMGRVPLTQRQMAVMQSYSDTDGGVSLPFTIDPTFINVSDGAVNPLRGMARIETITSKSWQAVTTEGVVAAYVGERTTTGASDGAPTDLDDPTATPVRADVAVDITSEYLQDYGAAALTSEIGRLIADAKDTLEADKFVMGDGSGEPEGIVAAIITDTTSIVPTATSDVFVLADVDTLIGALPARFRSRAKAQFMANLAIQQLLPAFGTAGQPGNAIYDALASTLRGYPIKESTAMDATVADAKEILLFGDFKTGFVIVDRVGLSSRVLDSYDSAGRPTGNSTIYASWRNTSKVLAFNAFRLLKVA